VDHPRVVREGVERAPRRQHEDVAVEALLDLGELLVGADREGVHAEPLRLAGQPAQAEPVAVALGDRYEPGVPVVHVPEVGTPAVAVDTEGQRHGSAPASQVELEGLVDRAVGQSAEREVPLPGVLHGLAAGADLELDQSDVVVVWRAR
jgi:hypothetical protein